MLFSLILGVLFNVPVQAEIQQITIRWTAPLCQETCTKLLMNEFRKIHGVAEIYIDQGSGQATLTWKERMPFEFTSVNTAMRMVGLSIRDIRIKVRGYVRHTGDTFYIVSEGDGTRFDLLNPVTPVRGGQTSEFNTLTRGISPALRQQFLDAEAQKLIATVEGPVFMPERKTVPTQIVVDSLSFSDPTKDAEKK